MPKGVYPRKPGQVRAPLATRFWSKVDRGGPDECWLWLGARSYRPVCNYGYFGGARRGLVLRAHRVSWELHFGSIPEGLSVLHTCDNGLCVNPAHLFLGTQRENVKDMNAKGRGRVVSGDAHPARAPGARRGQRNGRSKLTEADIPRIRALGRAGVPFKEIAREFGVATPTIQHVLSGKNWSHVPGHVPPLPRVKPRPGGKTAAEAGPRPLCGCHHEPMQWNKRPDLKAGGVWRCRVRLRRAVLAGV